MTPDRREFLKGAARKAAWSAPTVVVLLSASQQPLAANGIYEEESNHYPAAPSQDVEIV